MAVKKTTYINAELEWAEEQLVQWKAYVDANPLPSLKDRIEYKQTANGGQIPMVVASIESQGKFIQDTMKNYLALETRGGAALGSMAEDFLKSRG